MSEDAARRAEPELLEERRGDSGEIVWLTLNRPKARNALTFPMYERIGEVCLGSTPTLRCGLLCSPAQVGKRLPRAPTSRSSAPSTRRKTRSPTRSGWT